MLGTRAPGDHDSVPRATWRHSARLLPSPRQAFQRAASSPGPPGPTRAPAQGPVGGSEAPVADRTSELRGRGWGPVCRPPGPGWSALLPSPRERSGAGQPKSRLSGLFGPRGGAHQGPLRRSLRDPQRLCAETASPRQGLYALLQKVITAAFPVRQGRQHARRSFSHRASLPADAAAVAPPPRASLSSWKLRRVPDATAAAAAAVDDAVATAVVLPVSAGKGTQDQDRNILCRT